MKNKKIILSLLLITLVIAGVFGAWHGVFADPPPVQPPAAGNAIGDILGSSGWWWGMLLAIVLVVQAVFSVLLVVAGYFLNVMFRINVGFVPSLEPVVQVGWIVLRDIVNGIFIMLVLWIALTIILGIEQFGGKKLLAKVLAVAVLINFSLAIVTAIVVLSNQFAKAFSDKITEGTKNDLPKYIVGITQFQSITNTLTNDQIDQKKKEADQAAQIAASWDESQASAPFRDGMFASLGFNSASADSIDDQVTAQCTPIKTACYQRAGCIPPTEANPEPPQPAACNRTAMGQCDAEDSRCVTEIRKRLGASLLMRAAGVGSSVEYLNSLLESFKTQLGDWTKVTLSFLIQKSISVVLLAIVVTTFLYAAVALGIRFFAIIFLTIASPVAFLTVALPMNLGKQQGWSHWWSEFLKWVFFAPAFYFLIYLTLLMAGQMNTAFSGQPGAAAIGTDGRRLLGLFVVLGLLMYASRLAKKTSGKMGEFTVGLAKKVGGLAVGVTAGVATGGTLLAARGLARGMVKPGTKREAFVNKMASKPWARLAGAGALQRAGVRGQAERMADVNERKKQYSSMSNDQLLAQQRGSLGRLGGDARNNAAMLSLLAERGVMSSKNVTPEERAKATTIMGRYGMAADMNKIDATTTTDKTLTGSQKRDIAENEDKNSKAGFQVLPKAPVQFVAQNLTAEEIKNSAPAPLKVEGAANTEMLEGLARNKNFGTTQLRDLALKDIEAAQKFVNHMSETTLGALKTELDATNGIADQTLKANLKATLGARIAQIEGMAHYLDTSAGGRVLGIDFSQAPAMRAVAQRMRRGRRGQNDAGEDEEENPPANQPAPPGQNTGSFG